MLENRGEEERFGLRSNEPVVGMIGPYFHRSSHSCDGFERTCLSSVPKSFVSVVPYDRPTGTVILHTSPSSVFDLK